MRFGENDEQIGKVVVHVEGYTESSWIEGIPEDVQLFCEDAAVREFEKQMVKRVKRVVGKLAEPGMSITVLPLKLGN